jgi:hypothetical protein
MALHLVKLASLQDMIDQWVVCQATWMYLEPIFSSEDIIKQVRVVHNACTQLMLHGRCLWKQRLHLCTMLLPLFAAA